jgi:hypothetical protein
VEGQVVESRREKNVFCSPEKKDRRYLVTEQPSIQWVLRFLPWDKEEGA